MRDTSTDGPFLPLSLFYVSVFPVRALSRHSFPLGNLHPGRSSSFVSPGTFTFRMTSIGKRCEFEPAHETTWARGFLACHKLFVMISLVTLQLFQNVRTSGRTGRLFLRLVLRLTSKFAFRSVHVDLLWQLWCLVGDCNYTFSDECTMRPEAGAHWRHEKSGDFRFFCLGHAWVIRFAPGAGAWSWHLTCL